MKSPRLHRFSGARLWRGERKPEICEIIEKETKNNAHSFEYHHGRLDEGHELEMYDF